MTYNVSGWALNSYSLAHSLNCLKVYAKSSKTCFLSFGQWSKRLSFTLESINSVVNSVGRLKLNDIIESQY